MSESFRALCSDFYINHKLSVKMELPRGRETVLELFERMRRQYPTMSLFRRYREEFALESESGEGGHRWVAVRSNNIRSGVVNPESLAEGYTLHKHVLEIAPYFLNISPLDVDYVELLYGFDLQAGGNQDAIVAEAIYANTPVAELWDFSGGMVVDCQPLLGVAVGNRGELEIQYEIKTRGSNHPGKESDGSEPISVYLTLRRFGSPKDLAELATVFSDLAMHGEEIAQNKVLPLLIMPIREAIASGNS